MFREILNALAHGSTIDNAFSELGEMLEHGVWMFERANEVLHSKVPAQAVSESIYERDRAINELERSIRRKVLRYLTVNPGYDVPVCLALMSVAKDAERIGDYCKNVFEVGQFYNEDFTEARYRQALDQIAEETVVIFKLVSAACRDSDEGPASEAIEKAKSIRGRCDEIIMGLFRDEEQIQVHEAVAYSLLARHYKRVVAHLANISTALLGQFEDLDFYNDNDIAGKPKAS
ncbi:PhoU domain-containing protein [Gammaproteobacteria bacterium AB-CW1]|uniref:PhoU domain-containing protein n=1 Tax=Natronospira elongata TaxID=3110268 RepID=A0AAP6JGC2_9GAMM|nr:PhoU domain-containing protein [Gammaproteobacteria bacterium AB-CW1]